VNARRVDVLLAVGVIVILATIVTSGQGGRFTGPINPLAYVWTVGLGLLMLIRRSHPLLVLVLTTIGYFSYHAAGFPAMGVAVPVAAALFSAAEMGHTRAAVATGAVTLLGSTGYRVASNQNLAYVLGYELASHVALMAAVIALGHSLRTTRQLRLRRDQVTRLLARQRQLDAEVTKRDDRLTLARDLHDSIGHSLTVASIYAGLALERDVVPERRDQSLTMVRAAVSEALSHLRRTVRLLREQDAGQAGPGLEDIRQLAEAPRAAGYDVRVDVPDVAVPVPVGAAIYRLAQEGITNALKHSSGRRIEVRVSCAGPHMVDVSISDDGAGERTTPVELGHGLRGMRERVADLGGVLTVVSARSGWRVHATIPWEAA